EQVGRLLRRGVERRVGRGGCRGGHGCFQSGLRDLRGATILRRHWRVDAIPGPEGLMRDVFVVGVHTAPFKRWPDLSLKALARPMWEGVLAEAALQTDGYWPPVQSVFCVNAVK